MNNQELTDFLKECGVCQICQLRYLKARGSEYQDMKESFEKLNVKLTIPDDNEVLSKKSRPNPCSTCLGLFSEEFQQEIIDKITCCNIDQFDCQQIGIALSMPMLLQIRQLSMWFALMKKFGSKIDEERSPDVPLKEAAKLILNPIICKKLNKTYNSEGILINVFLDHPDEENDVAKLLKVNESVFSMKNAKGKKQLITRAYMEKMFIPSKLSADTFAKQFEVPCPIPNSYLILKEVTLAGPCVFVAGRYRKLSRKLSHSPWVLQGKRVMEDSIQEIIIRNIAKHFGVEEGKIIFSSSGREDVDVRCLGQGRPFVLEIPNSKRMTLPKTLAHDIELEIEKSASISVKNLQMVLRDDLVHIKTGEEKKKKFYRAMCVIEQPITVEVLKKLDLPNGFDIEQITPIRVLHRRPLLSRPRTIYSTKAWVDEQNPKILIIDIISQAGTYIKELVHGDFGRTSPSFASIIGQPIDIIALDVVGIDLDWPANVDNSKLDENEVNGNGLAS
ncbi:putative tRNA pseudouridine synthase Pus10 [Episyrphus balteatus]|uniref:putative tRNA pseudouridine synthase Pus10 n=1 Tax=Episyrphus balteatus TaxID=286459 RepID=UPI002486659D|nr:putative tRNA pseudouridine synthase Pus10 [Episyrphus balteatus]